MTVYDPAWDMPEPNWRPVGSFQQAAPSPGVNPTAEPVVCIPVNAAWVKVLIGCIDQLCIPATWATSSDDDLNGILQWVALLKQQVANAEACMRLRWSDADCAVEQSMDGGATWSKISGWPVGPPACFVGAAGATGAAGSAGATGATGATGAAGPAAIWRVSGCALQYSNDGGSTWSTASGWSLAAIQACLVGTPTNPQGVSVDQQGCNIATYITTNLIKASLQKVVDRINAADSLFGITNSVLGILLGFDVVLGLAVAAVTAMAEIVLASTLSDYTTDLANTSLWASVQCAIYLAIRADGMVTAANFAALRAAVAAVTWPHGDVKSAVLAYLDGLGASGLVALQAPGSAVVGDCSGCGPPLGCAAMVSTHTATCCTYDATNGVFAKVSDSSHYGGVTGPSPLQSAPYKLTARVTAGAGRIGFYTTAGHGLPDCGDNAWVNNVDVALVWSGGTWIVELFGATVNTGTRGAIGSTLEIRFDPAGPNFKCFVDGVQVGATAPVGAAAYKPVVWGFGTTDAADRVYVCT